MKQKIVINVQMRCSKCRSEAMKIVASAYGVMSVVIQGSEKDVIVVVGDGVDSVGVCSELRKKVGRTILVSVEQVKDNPKTEEIKKKEDEKKKITHGHDHDHDHDHGDQKKKSAIKKVTWLL